MPQLFAQAFPNDSDLIWEGSAGKGNWSDAPWIAAFDPLVTESAQRGYYPVYLFDSSLTSVYLSLNQGVTDLKDEFGTKIAKEILEHRASLLRARPFLELDVDLSPDREGFSDRPIKLKPRSASSLLGMYEAGHAFGTQYRKGRVPDDEKVLADMATMLALYRKVLALGGVAEMDLAHHGPKDEPRSQDEIRRYRRHMSIERNPGLAKDAKKYHGYVCQACGFDFERHYGALGHEYIEAHHLIPLSMLPMETPTPHSPKDDFALLCGNCHRMIHRKNAPGTFGEFVGLVRERKLRLL